MEGEELPSSARIEPGTVLNGTYRIERLIGSGGMGNVWLATNIEIEEQEAVKVIKAEWANQPKIATLLRKEAKSLRQLAVPEIALFRACATDQQVNALYLVTEYVNGYPLTDRIDGNPSHPRDVLKLLKRVGTGLKAAHDLNIIHRDISPDNILLPGNNLERAKIIDFGIAKDLAPGAETVVGDGFAGRWDYSAPELFSYGRLPVGPWSDIYSLGLVAMALAQGEAVEMGTTMAEAYAARQKIIDLDKVPPILHGLLAHMLHPEHEQRMQSMDDLLMKIGPIMIKLDRNRFVEPVTATLETQAAGSVAAEFTAPAIEPVEFTDDRKKTTRVSAEPVTLIDGSPFATHGQEVASSTLKGPGKVAPVVLPVPVAEIVVPSPVESRIGVDEPLQANDLSDKGEFLSDPVRPGGTPISRRAAEEVERLGEVKERGPVSLKDIGRPVIAFDYQPTIDGTQEQPEKAVDPASSPPRSVVWSNRPARPLWLTSGLALIVALIFVTVWEVQSTPHRPQGRLQAYADVSSTVGQDGIVAAFKSGMATAAVADDGRNLVVFDKTASNVTFDVSLRRDGNQLVAQIRGGPGTDLSQSFELRVPWVKAYAPTKNLATQIARALRSADWALGKRASVLSNSDLSTVLVAWLRLNIKETGSGYESLLMTRELIAKYPSSSGLWAQRAYFASWDAINTTDVSVRKAMYSEVYSSLKKARALDPKASLTYAAEWISLPIGDRAGDEKVARAGISVDPNNSQLNLILSSSLRSVGRFADASAYAIRAYQIAPQDESAASEFLTLRGATLSSWQDLADRFDRDWPDSKIWLRARLAYQNREFPRVRQLVAAGYKNGSPMDRATLLSTLESVETGKGLSVDQLAAVERLSNNDSTNNELVRKILIDWGRKKIALDAAIRSKDFMMIFSSDLKSETSGGAFRRFAVEQSAWRYWIEGNPLPDICNGDDPAPVCKQISAERRQKT